MGVDLVRLWIAADRSILEAELAGLGGFHSDRENKSLSANKMESRMIAYSLGIRVGSAGGRRMLRYR